MTVRVLGSRYSLMRTGTDVTACCESAGLNVTDARHEILDPTSLACTVYVRSIAPAIDTPFLRH